MKRGAGARLGQHFLKHAWVAAKLAHAIPLREGEIFLEIGPGKGALTRELLKLGPVLAVEKDAGLVATLMHEFEKEISQGALTLIADDIRAFDPKRHGLFARRYVVAANIPYYITGEIIRHFLTAQRQPRAMALLVQKEIADRIIAKDKKESLLSLSVKAFGKPRAVARVGKGHFSPPPSVDSAIIVIDEISRDFFSGINEDRFFELLHLGFGSKRKMLRGNLGSIEGFATCRIPETARAEDLSLQEWRCLSCYCPQSP